MSIQSEITRLSGAKSDIADAIEGKGVTVPSTAKLDEYATLVSQIDMGTKMVVLSYGHSTWQDFIDAYAENAVVYCRASSNSNPATGSQTRMAFMAYVSNAETPTNVEFQYYRSVSSHSATQQGDQVYVYKLTNSNGGTWTVTVREAYTKIVAGTGLTSSYNSGELTLNVSAGPYVADVAYDSTTHKITQTIGSTTSDVIGLATSSGDGLMSSADKTKLDATLEFTFVGEI